MFSGLRKCACRQSIVLAVTALLPVFTIAAEHDYRISVDEKLSRINVEARFAEPVHRIRAGSRRAEGYLRSARDCESDESLQAIARHLEMSAEELEGVATFYNLIFRRPVGDKVILLCNSISCWIKGCDKLQARITEQLGIEVGETTADNRYTLLPVTCLGACDKAPVMMVGEDLHEDIGEQTIGELFREGEE